jgi:hypothetical protein
MTLQASGALTLNDIQTEFGGANPIGFDEYYAGGSYVPAGTSGTNGAVPSSGTISISNFYGTSAYTGVWFLYQDFSSSSSILEFAMSVATAPDQLLTVQLSWLFTGPYRGIIQVIDKAGVVNYSTFVQFSPSLIDRSTSSVSGGSVYLGTGNNGQTGSVVFGSLTYTQTSAFSKFISFAGNTLSAGGLYSDSVSSYYIACNCSTTKNSVLLKYNDTPTLTWAKSITHTTSTYSINFSSLGTSGNNDMVPVGYIDTDSFSTRQPLACKFNTSGTFDWARGLDPSSVSGVSGLQYKGASRGSSDYYVCGDWSSSIGNVRYAFLVKYNSSGVLQWQRIVSSPTSTYNIFATTVVIEDYGHGSTPDIYFVGSVELTSGKTSTFIIKYNGSGTLQWQRTMTGSTYSIGPAGATITDLFSTPRLEITASVSSSGANYGVVTFKIPLDGSHTGTFTSTQTFTYAASSLVDATGSFTDVDRSSNLTIADASGSITTSNYTFASAAATYTSTLKGF